MSKLEELIQELCPNGVEYKCIKDLCIITTGRLNANAMVENGEYEFFTCSKESFKTNSYAFDGEALLIAGNGYIGDVKHFKGKFDAYQRTYVLMNFDNKINIRFMFHCFKRNFREYAQRFQKEGSVPYITLGTLENYKVPVPPIKVQSEIVRILDNFTLLTAELTAELTARKKQYEYYRDSLLTFDVNIPKVKLGEIATDIYRGSGITREMVTEIGIPCVRYGEIYTKYNLWFDTCVSHTKIENVQNPKYFEYGDILFAITGESVEDIAKSVAYVGNEKCLAGGDIVVLKHNQNPKYLSLVLSTTDAVKQKGKGKVKSKVVHSSAPAISEIEIPLPSLEVQERLVNVLENFESLCNDLGIGLPAEIEARQQQYEFYRTKLLTMLSEGVN